MTMSSNSTWRSCTAKNRITGYPSQDPLVFITTYEMGFQMTFSTCTGKKSGNGLKGRKYPYNDPWIWEIRIRLINVIQMNRHYQNTG
jgi:hypothetical protein